MADAIVRAVRPNAGLRIKYEKQILALISEMSASVEYWLQAAYRAAPPRVAALVAQDASPSQEINKQLRELAKRWLKKIDGVAPKIAEAYLKASRTATDSAYRAALKDVGLTVKFELTPAMQDAFEAKLTENIGLIRSIPEQYLSRVETIVNQAYSSGRDLASMMKGIQKLHPQAQRKTVLIVRDQSNKANAVVIRTRQMELGIVEAKWMHSTGGKVPRPDHVAANGKVYKIAEGCQISGKFIQPGEEINCRCVSRAILPGLG